MRTIAELEELLFEELRSTKQNIKELNYPPLYYNETSGKSSLYFTSLLYENLVGNSDWDKRKWLDDSLLTKIVFEENRYRVWAVVISGREGTTKQWTDPAYFEIIPSTNFSGFSEYTYLFADKYVESLDYKEYSRNRAYWDKGFYSNENWDPSERDWDLITHIHKSD